MGFSPALLIRAGPQKNWGVASSRPHSAMTVRGQVELGVQPQMKKSVEGSVRATASPALLAEVLPKKGA
jgi:hypothetical protein